MKKRDKIICVCIGAFMVVASAVAGIICFLMREKRNEAGK